MMLSVLLWLSFIYGMYNGAMIPALTEIMPAEVRVAGFSLAYSPGDRGVWRLHAGDFHSAD